MRARLDGAAEQFADGMIDGAQLSKISQRLEARLEAAEFRLASLLRSHGIGESTVEMLHAGYPLGPGRP